MTTVHLVTDSFPYPPGEQFLWEEVYFWGKTDVELRILPCKAGHSQLQMPSNVSVHADLAGVSRVHIAIMALLLPFYGFFYRELRSVVRNDALKYKVVRGIIISSARMLIYRRKLKKYILRHGPIDLLYCYWNDVHAYAASTLKFEGQIKRIVTRAHGGDVYRERWPADYMPLKWQFTEGFDRVYVLSELARRYVMETYRIASEKIEVSPLGVVLGVKRSRRSEAGSIHLVSVAFCIDVKRIDRIIETVALLGRQHTDIQVDWTHIGDGPLQSNLISLAESTFGGIKNVAYRFTGRMSTADVQQYLLDEPCDVFLNTSESEGMPVSIMEAMSVGIPAVAPDVGGISELIQRECGRLLSADAGPEEIVASIWDLYTDPSIDAIREAARLQVIHKFNAEVNYPKFIASVVQDHPRNGPAGATSS